MIDFSRNLLDPTADDLHGALADAARAGGGVPVRWKADVLRRYDAEPEGNAEHRWPRRGRDRRKAHLAWWRDAVGRRHVRVVGLVAEGVERLEFPDGHDDAPPLLRIYPDAGFLVDDAAVLVICPCGAAGRPDEIGWVGGECGPCHDRRVGGELTARPWDVPEREFTPGACLAWLSEASLLLREDGVTTVRDITSGAAVPLKEQFGSQAIWCSRDGRRVAVQDPEWIGPGIHILCTQTARFISSFGYLLPFLDRGEFSPSGRYFVAVFVHPDDSRQALYVYDSHLPKPEPLRLEGGTGAFSWDETRFFVADNACPFGLRAIPLAPDGPPCEVLAPGISDPACGIWVCPGGATVVLRTVNLLLAVDARTGEILGIPQASVVGPGPGVLTCDGRVLVAGAQNTSELLLFTMPDLAPPRRLTALEGPRTDSLLENGHWLALSDGDRTRLVPWPPLLDWFLRQED